MDRRNLDSRHILHRKNILSDCWIVNPPDVPIHSIQVLCHGNGVLVRTLTADRYPIRAQEQDQINTCKAILGSKYNTLTRRTRKLYFAQHTP